MFFNKHKKIGERLAASAIWYCGEQISEILSSRQFPEIEVMRLKFCLYVLNITMTICLVSFHERNRSNAKKIVDTTFENFINAFKQPIETTSFKDYPRMGDLIIDHDEKLLISTAMGGGTNDNTRTTYDALLGLAYNIRLRQYSDILRKKVLDVFSEEQPSISDPLVELFAKHFAGEERLKDISLVVGLGFILTKSFLVFNSFVKEVLQGKV